MNDLCEFGVTSGNIPLYSKGKFQEQTRSCM